MKRLLPFLFLFCAGCSSVAPSKAFQNVFWEERPKTPGRMVAFWQCYTQTNPDGDLPLRGVGGRIFFYGEKETSEPIKVDGDLTIFLFDAHDPLPQQSVPIKQAIFQKEVLSVFLRKDREGMNGYEFFVPVDEVGNEEMDLQVLAMFRETKKPGKPLGTESQTVIHSRLVEVTLPGPKRQEFAFENENAGNAAVIDLAGGRDEPYGIIQASYQQQVRLPQTPEPDLRRRSSETIRLPDRFARALQYDQHNNISHIPAETHSETAAPTASPYGRSTASEPNIPQYQDNRNLSGSNSALSQNTNHWVKTPSRMLEVAQRNSMTSNDKPFRIDSNTGSTGPSNPTPELVYEDVSKSGIPTRVWLQ